MAKHRTATDPPAPEESERIPRPVPGGTEHIESLGHFIDNIMGDARMRKAVERELERLYLKDDEAPQDPPPVELPEPVPGGSEEFTEGDRAAEGGSDLG